MKRLRILYAGDSPVGGPANYLLGVLRLLKAEVRHVAPSRRLAARDLKPAPNVFIFSDYSKDQISRQIENQIVGQIQNGAGLWMIGGWGSFSGPFGKWRGSRIEKLLPVSCSPDDDRINFPSGAWALPTSGKSWLRPEWFQSPPVLCGLNRVSPRKGSRTLLEARKITGSKKKIALDAAGYSLLVISQNLPYKSCALATDLAPHWAGGLVDWGRRELTLPVAKGIQVQVGDYYVKFVAAILKWLSSPPPRILNSSSDFASAWR